MAERIAAVPVESGLFVLRYAATNSSIPPKVYVRVSPSAAKAVRLVAAPGNKMGELTNVGDCLVVSAKERSLLHVTLSQPGTDANLDANIRLERLTGAPAKSGLSSKDSSGGGEIAFSQTDRANGALGIVNLPSPATGETPISEAGLNGVHPFSCLAHVARRGDQVFASGDWIGGPTTPMRIEGLQLDCQFPGLDVHYQVIVAGARGRWSNWVSAGSFAGSRGRALPLAGVRFRLEGERAQNFEIRAEALFLGSSIESEVGAAIEFASRTGNDPLVGLRVAIAERSPLAEEETAPADGTTDLTQGSLDEQAIVAVSATDGGLHTLRRGRVRVFRARPGGVSIPVEEPAISG